MKICITNLIFFDRYYYVILHDFIILECVLPLPELRASRYRNIRYFSPALVATKFLVIIILCIAS